MDTSSADLVQEFFVPALSRAIRYDQAIGYFSSGWLRANAKGMLRFATNGSRGRWVTSPILAEADWEALQLGEAAVSKLAQQPSVSYGGRRAPGAIVETRGRASKPPQPDEQCHALPSWLGSRASC